MASTSERIDTLKLMFRHEKSYDMREIIKKGNYLFKYMAEKVARKLKNHAYQLDFGSGWLSNLLTAMNTKCVNRYKIICTDASRLKQLNKLQKKLGEEFMKNDIATIANQDDCGFEIALLKADQNHQENLQEAIDILKTLERSENNELKTLIDLMTLYEKLSAVSVCVWVIQEAEKLNKL